MEEEVVGHRLRPMTGKRVGAIGWYHQPSKEYIEKGTKGKSVYCYGS